MTSIHFQLVGHPLSLLKLVPLLMFGERVHASIWHSGLGHSASAAFQHSASSFHLPVDGSPKLSSVCTQCQINKSKKSPFSLSSSISSQPLDLIQCDLWGSSPELLISGYNYYVSFIDDCTKYAWIYPLTIKSQTFVTFLKFKAYVENMMSSMTKALQYDGSGEFMSTHFQIFLESNGITHRVSCLHTPEQNGVAERKHRHIAEMGLTLLAIAKMPLQYWVEAFNTVVFLINRLPTKILKNKLLGNVYFIEPLTIAFFALLDAFVSHGYELIVKIN